MALASWACCKYEISICETLREASRTYSVLDECQLLLFSSLLPSSIVGTLREIKNETVQRGQRYPVLP